MVTLREHDVILRSGHIILRPMTEHDWEILYPWYNDPEVLYYSEGDDVTGYSLEDIQEIYRGDDPLAKICFVIEFDGLPVGDCWLQRLNLEHLLRQFPQWDCRRIDLVIGEKAYWNRGIGTEVIRLLTDFGFRLERADAIFGCVADYNLRSRRAFEKNGYTLYQETPEAEGMKAKVNHDLMLTREAWEKQEHVR